MPPISRGFFGRRADVDPSRLPPGQYLTHDFPVLSAGPTPRLDLDTWAFEVTGATEQPRSWTWEELNALPMETVTRDIHCVTKWSKLDTVWTGVSLDVLLDGIDTAATHVMAHSYGGYTTNLPLADVRDGKAWIALYYEEQPVPPEHGGPARLLVPHLYFWKSAKWVRGIELMEVMGKEMEIPKHLDHPTFQERIEYLTEYWTNDVRYAFVSFKIGINAMDIDTAVRHRINVVCVISNNGGWTADAPWSRPLPKPGRNLGFTRYDRLAMDLGAHGEHVEKPNDIRPALDRAFAAGKPAVINVITDHTARATTVRFSAYST